MTVSMRHSSSQLSVFSLNVSDESSECSDLSWYDDIDSDEDSSTYYPEEDYYLDSQMMKGGFILEKPLDLHELDRLLDWGVGTKAAKEEAPLARPSFRKSVSDSAVVPPTRRPSFSDDRPYASARSFRSSAMGASGDLFSVISDEYDSKDLDSLGDSDSDDDYETYYGESYQRSKSFTSLLGFEDIIDDGPETPPLSNVTRKKAIMIQQVASMGSMADEDTSVADSAYISMGISASEPTMGMESMPQEKRNNRWTEGSPLEKRISDTNQDSRWTEGAPQEKRISDTIQDSRWSEGAPLEKRLSDKSLDSRWNEGAPQEKRMSDTDSLSKSAKSEGSTMPPPKRRLSNIGNWNISKRNSLTSSAVNFEMINQQIQAEVGLRLTNSLPAQKIMEAIMAALQNQEEESNQEEMRPQSSIIEGTHRRGSLPRPQ